MKRIIAFLMSLMLVLSLCACQIPEVDTPTTDSTISTVVIDPTETTLSTETTITTVPSTNTTENNTTAVEITSPSVVYDGFIITEDYEGKPALIIFMTWTNNTKDTTMFATEYSIDVFQAGIGLDSVCIIMNDEYTDALNATMTEIRPGATIEVAHSFLLRDTTSKIEIEVDEWISFDNEIISFIEIDPTAVG